MQRACNETTMLLGQFNPSMGTINILKEIEAQRG